MKGNEIRAYLKALSLTQRLYRIKRFLVWSFGNGLTPNDIKK